MRKTIICFWCKGKGKIVDTMETLKKNKGRIFYDNFLNVMKNCRHCKGKGKIKL